MSTDRPRYTVSVDDELFEKLEDFRYANRYPTRAAASAALLRLGLEEFERRKKEKEGKEKK